jgi:hypothetical protein
MWRRHDRIGFPQVGERYPEFAMMLAGFTGLGLGAASLAFASIPDVAGTLYGHYHDTGRIHMREQPTDMPPPSTSLNPPEAGDR